MNEELNKDEIFSIQKFVSKDFVKNDSSSLVPNNDYERLEEFRKYLTDKMKDMLDKNYNLLINTLYRIDISEKELSELFSAKNKDSIPQKLADLIIERQIEKINYRKRYREGNL
jgi:dsDNA-binding SOS-regulon protein